MDMQTTPRPQWASPTSYLLVTVGAVVGVGNVLFFPFLVLQYGGLFVVFYLLCELFLAVPLLYAELMLGHRGKQNVVGSITLLAYTATASRHWRKLGWLYFAVAFLTFAYYVVYAAFPVGFLIDSIQSLFAPTGAEYLPIVPNNQLLGSFFVLAPCVLLLLLTTMLVVGRGLHRGLEKISCIIVPMYFSILLALAIYMTFTHSINATLNHLLSVYPGNSILAVFLAALAFAFLKLKIGIGSMVAYGSHLPFSVSLKRSTLWVVLFDMLVSLLAYLIIAPLIQPLSADIYSGALNSENVAIVFTHIPHGAIIALLFFCAAILAAWTPLIAMLETMVATVSEEFNMLRIRAVWLVSSGLFLLASLIILGQTTWFNHLLLEYISAPNSLRELVLERFIPVSAFFMALFAGWVIDQRVSSTDLQFKPWLFHTWRFLMRYVIPALILAVFVYGFFENYN